MFSIAQAAVTNSTVIPTTSTTDRNITTTLNPLYSNPFLVNLAKSLNVTSIPLAIFLLILICLACIFIVAIVIICVRSFVKRKYVPRRQKRRQKPVYVDEIPGLEKSNESTTKYGTLEYSIEYKLENSQLKVGVIQANDLCAPPGVEILDPYTTVTVVLQDNDHLKLIGKQEKTNVIMKNNNPCWQKIFNYTILESDLRKTKIIFEVFDYDNICQDASIGKLEVLLKSEDPSEFTGKVSERTGNLTAGHTGSLGLGELCIGMGYYPLNERLDVCIYEAKNLQLDELIPLEKQRKLDITISLKRKKHTITKERTQVRKEMTNPYFNQKFTFTLEEKHKLDSYIICQLRHHNRTGRKQVLGDFWLGLDSPQTTGVKHWEEILNNPSKIHVMWHSITPKSNE